MNSATDIRPQPPSESSRNSLPGSIDLSVIVVNYNVREFLEQALRSINRASDGLKVEIFVVDNNSSDGSVEMVRNRFPEVHLIANEENTGFSAANNQAIRQASGRYLLILNPDTIVREDTLQALVRFMDEHPDAGAAGCKILNPDGSFAPESRRAFPTPAVAFYRITGLSKLFPRSARFGRYNMSYLPPDEAAEVDALSGSCMMVRHEALLRRADTAHSPEINGVAHVTYDGAGLFDEAFFMYGEDLDWCFRIQQAGWKIYYTPETQIIHYKGESTKKGELRYVMLFYGAMLRFAEKHFKSRHSWLFRIFLRGGIVARGSLQVVSNGLKRFSTPLIDAAITFAMVAAAGFLRFLPDNLTFPPLFVGLIAPLYTLATAVSISALGGYKHTGRTRILPVISGSLIAFAILGTTSFFVKNIAFSRLAILLGFCMALVALCLIRIIRVYRKPPTLFRRTIFVGNHDEAQRLNQLFSAERAPSMELLGYVGEQPAGEPAKDLDVPFLASLRHLRDIVRLQRIDDVVFGSSALSNRTIFDLIQQLRDLPVSLKILSPNLEHLISPARIDELTATPALIDAERAFGLQRSTLARRAFEVTLATAGLVLRPILYLMAAATGKNSWWRVLIEKTKNMPQVLVGKHALVGFRREEAPFISASWQLKPGIFTITDTLPPRTKRSQDINRAYWLYVCNQSMALDLDIIFRSIKQIRAQYAGR